MRNNDSMPVYKNAGSSFQPDDKNPKQITRMKRDRFSDRTVVTVRAISRQKTQDNKEIRVTTLISRTPSRPPSEGFITLEDRQKDAAARAEHRASLTPLQQLKELDKRLGKGSGAQKERARLNAMLATEKIAVDALRAKAAEVVATAAAKKAVDGAMPRRPGRTRQ